MKKLITSLLTLACVAGATAQVKFDGQYRSRGEARNGFKKPLVEGLDAGAFIEHRARLSYNFV